MIAACSAPLSSLSVPGVELVDGVTVVLIFLAMMMLLTDEERGWRKRC